MDTKLAVHDKAVVVVVVQVVERELLKEEGCHVRCEGRKGWLLWKNRHPIPPSGYLYTPSPSHILSLSLCMCNTDFDDGYDLYVQRWTLGDLYKGEKGVRGEG